MRRGLALGCAAAAVAAAALLLVVGLDVLRWRGQLDSADLRFAARTGEAGMWEPDTRLPGGVARTLLGVDDDLDYRRAAQGFRVARIGMQARDLADVGRRGRVETELARLERTDEDARRRSLVANLQGVIAFEGAREEEGQAPVLLRRSLDSFRKAIRFDPGNEDAKYNLELVLRLLQQVEEAGAPGGQGQRGESPASGAGAASQGSGY